jgi:hypothetical protein
VRILAERGFPERAVRLFASAGSPAKRRSWQDGEIVVEDAATADYRGLDVVFFSAGGAASRALVGVDELESQMRSAGAGATALMRDGAALALPVGAKWSFCARRQVYGYATCPIRLRRRSATICWSAASAPTRRSSTALPCSSAATTCARARRSTPCRLPSPAAQGARREEAGVAAGVAARAGSFGVVFDQQLLVEGHCCRGRWLGFLLAFDDVSSGST